MAAGDFTASAIQQITLKEEQIWANPRDRQVFIPNVDTLAAVINNQSARVEPIEGTSKKDADVKVTWIDVAGLDGTDALTADCTPEPAELESAEQVDTLDIKREAKPFSVKTFIQPRDNVFSAVEIIAKGLMKQKKELDDYLNQTVIAELLTYAGANQYPESETVGLDYVVDNTITTIDPTLWNEDIMPLFSIIAKTNKFSNPMFVHGFNLYEIAKVAAGLDALNDNERDRLAKYQLFRHVWDPVSFAALTENNLSLAIDAGAVAFGSKAYHPLEAPFSPKSDVFLWSTPSLAIPGVFYDVTRTTRCVAVTSVGEEYVDAYQMRVHAGLFNNPVHTTGYTGVLEIRKA